MKNKIQKLVILFMAVALSACGFGEEKCNDVRSFKDPTINILEIDNVNFSDVDFYDYQISGHQIAIFMGTESLSEHRDEQIFLDFIDSDIGQTTTTIIDNQQIMIGNSSETWNGVATLTIIDIQGKRVEYSYFIDIQSGSSSLKIEGRVESTKNTHCYGPYGD